MVARNYYDVIVIGMQLGPLLTAALLARRGFRVLVIGHDDLPWTYSWNGMRLQTEPFTLAGADSPAVRRVLSELSLTQMFKRRTTANVPAYQVVLPDHRIDFTPDPDDFGAETDREFPGSRRAIESFYAAVDQCNGEIDKLVGADIVLPPDSFFERREFARASVHNPFARTRGPVDLFTDLPPEHPFRTAVLAQVRWASDLDTGDRSPLQVVRLHGAWARGTLSIEGGLDGLKQLVLDRISTHSGEVRRDLSADRIVVRRGRAIGVRMATQDDVTGCNFVILGSDVRHLAHLVDERELGRRFGARLSQVRPAALRYTLNLVVDSRVVPEGMARNVLYVGSPSGDLLEEDLLRIEVSDQPTDGSSLLCAGALLRPERLEEPGYLSGMRERVLKRLRWLVPFLDAYTLAIDSPHDGLPLHDVRGGRDVEVGEKWARSPDRMSTVCSIDPPGPLDITGIPHRTGIKHLLLACRQVVPGLAMEGEFLAALGAARLVARSDRRKGSLRRDAWTKIDL